MIKLGNKVKVTVGESVRPLVRGLFEALGANRSTPTDRMDVFALDDNGSIGFAYVAEHEALTAAQMVVAPWLEFVVPDVAAARARLVALGLAELAYHDKAHPYFVGPGGVVFRLAVDG